MLSEMCEIKAGMEVKIVTEKPTETADLSLWGLTDSEETARVPAWDPPRPSEFCGSCIAWSFVGPLAVSLKCELAFWNLFSMVGCLVQP